MMSGFTKEQSEAVPDRLSAQEIINAVNTLSDGEKSSFAKIARLYAKKTRYDREDLLQEAYSRILDGRRGWSKGVPAVLFFSGVIRSIAWDWKNEFFNEEFDFVDDGA